MMLLFLNLICFMVDCGFLMMLKVSVSVWFLRCLMCGVMVVLRNFCFVRKECRFDRLLLM